LRNAQVPAYYVNNLNHFLRSSSNDNRKKPAGTIPYTDGNKPGVRSDVCNLHNIDSRALIIYDS